ncbi:MAG: alanine:cation symporter family protein [Defluviitaleaceae bacterium]|nr:alanine:cation symporter family protein [Defluviitaleaceae bacterium]
MVIHEIASYIWSLPLLLLCIGSGLAFSFGTKFVQIRYFKEMIRQMLNKQKSDVGISSFQSLMLGLSGRLGTGNIAGIATAIAVGGPGAIFWMWVISFLGAGSAFAESTLGQIYKIKEDGEYRGGPSYYIEKGLGLKWYAIIFSISILLSYIIFLPGIQANAITTSLYEAFGIPPITMGILIVISLAILIRGGIKGFAKFSEIIIPFMTIGYLLMSWIIIAVNFEKVPSAIWLIISSAMGIQQAFAGIVGVAISYGIRRGVFSTESGLGTQVSSAAAAGTKHPVTQGLVQAFSIYIDTFLVSTSTAIMLIVTNSYNVIAPNNGYIVKNLDIETYGGAEFAIAATQGVFSNLGRSLVAISIFFFAYTVFVTYYYVAETNLLYIFKGKKIKWLMWIIELLFLFFIFRGSIVSSENAWSMADIGVGISAWVNLIAILLLYKPLMVCFKDYEKQIKQKKEPVFNSKNFLEKYSKIQEK